MPNPNLSGDDALREALMRNGLQSLMPAFGLGSGTPGLAGRAAERRKVRSEQLELEAQENLQSYARRVGLPAEIAVPAGRAERTQQAMQSRQLTVGQAKHGWNAAIEILKQGGRIDLEVLRQAGRKELRDIINDNQMEALDKRLALSRHIFQWNKYQNQLDREEGSAKDAVKTKEGLYRDLFNMAKDRLTAIGRELVTASDEERRNKLYEEAAAMRAEMANAQKGLQKVADEVMRRSDAAEDPEAADRNRRTQGATTRPVGVPGSQPAAGPGLPSQGAQGPAAVPAAGPTSGPPNALPVVNTLEQYQSLPPGAQYIDSQGQTRQKRQ